MSVCLLGRKPLTAALNSKYFNRSPLGKIDKISAQKPINQSTDQSVNQSINQSTPLFSRIGYREG